MIDIISIICLVIAMTCAATLGAIWVYECIVHIYETYISVKEGEEK